MNTSTLRAKSTDLNKRDMKSLNQILEIVCDQLEVDIFQVQSKDRTRELVNARKIFCLMALRFHYSTLSTVGKMAGLNDHSCVRYHANTAEGFIHSYDWFKVICDEIEYKIIS